MRVLIVNTSERAGGAAVAAWRLTEALNNNGVKAKMLVGDKQTDSITVAALPGRRRRRWCFLWERLVIFAHMGFSRKHLFEADIANAGTDITRTREFREADVIHLHWINQGMLSTSGIRRILDSGKPVVWTMHDMWPATAICHLTLGCKAFKTGCARCRLLPGHGGDGDLAAKTWRRKAAMLRGRHISYVTCSQWLGGEARDSALLKGQTVTTIPNPIDTGLFRPADRSAARRAAGLPEGKRIILFVAQKATNWYKGMDYLAEACRMMAEQYPGMKDDTAVAVIGGHADDVMQGIPFEAFPLGYISDERTMAAVYNAADVFVLPSLSENLPNTIMEAMACGVPCVGFRVGGIPEMIDHRQNGYVADLASAEDLAKGLRWVLHEADREKLAAAALRKVAANWSQQSVAMRYIEVYNHALAIKHYKL
ncbi:MAG: glycosyltransferase [Prevotella sp.]|nr:glycosyltransferase [Prevotella sp.]